MFCADVHISRRILLAVLWQQVVQLGDLLHVEQRLLSCLLLTWFSGGASSSLLTFCTSDSACLYRPIASSALARRSSAFWLLGATSSAAVHSFTASLYLLCTFDHVDNVHIVSLATKLQFRTCARSYLRWASETACVGQAGYHRTT